MKKLKFQRFSQDWILLKRHGHSKFIILLNLHTLVFFTRIYSTYLFLNNICEVVSIQSRKQPHTKWPLTIYIRRRTRSTQRKIWVLKYLFVNFYITSIDFLLLRYFIWNPSVYEYWVLHLFIVYGNDIYCRHCASL